MWYQPRSLRLIEAHSTTTLSRVHVQQTGVVCPYGQIFVSVSTQARDEDSIHMTIPSLNLMERDVCGTFRPENPLAAVLCNRLIGISILTTHCWGFLRRIQMWIAPFNINIFIPILCSRIPWHINRSVGSVNRELIQFRHIRALREEGNGLIIEHTMETDNRESTF